MNKLSIYKPETNQEYIIEVLSDIEIGDTGFNIKTNAIKICENNEDYLTMNQEVFDSFFKPSRIFYKLIEIVENSEKVKTLKEKMFSK